MSDSRQKTHEYISEQCDVDQQASVQQQTDAADGSGTDAPRSDFRDTMRDDALAAAEKGLEAAHAALAAAEKRLAEAQREAACRRAEKSDSSDAIPIEPMESSSQCSEACAKSAEVPTVVDQSAEVPVAADRPVEAPAAADQPPVEYAVPQSAPQAPVGAPYGYSAVQASYQDPRTAQGYAPQGYPPQGRSNACSQMSPNQEGAGSFSQAGAPSGQQSYYQAYQSQGQPNANQAYAPYDTTYQQQSVPRQPPVQPHYAPPLASRDHVAAGLLAIFLGGFGVHKFYLGYNTQGFIMLALGLIGGVLSFGLALGVVWIIAFIEGIIYLVKPQSEFERTYIYGKREWF